MNSNLKIQDNLIRWTLSGLVVISLAGCGRDDTKVYTVAHDSGMAPSPAAMPASSPGDMGVPPAAQMGAPQLSWTLPSGWTEKPAGEMRVASFSAPGKAGQLVDISVVPLPGMAGGDLSNVNRWRGQVGLAPIQEEYLARQGEEISVGDAKAMLYDMVGMQAGDDAKKRILAVGLRREDMMWFFKATGEDESVASQKSNFISLLKSVHFAAADVNAALPAGHPAMDATAMPAGHPPMDAGAMAPAMTAPPADGSLPTWTVPTAWQQVPPTAMLLAKFSTTENGQKADITISSLAGEGGGLLGNVNRWRGQISLPPLDDAGAAQGVTTLDTAVGPASLVDMNGTGKTGQPVRMVGVILPVNDKTWFYKFMGDATVVDHQKADFLKFVQSAKY